MRQSPTPLKKEEKTNNNSMKGSNTMQTWFWEATYNDGTVIKEKDNHGIKDIDQSKLAFISMVKDDKRHVLIFDPPHMKLVVFGRVNVIQKWNEQGRVIDTIEIYRRVFGYETKIKGTVHKVLLVIMPDDSIVITDDVDKVKIQ